MQEQQTIFAALSLGPVGISDQLTSHPTNASATITSNVGDRTRVLPLQYAVTTAILNGTAEGGGWKGCGGERMNACHVTYILFMLMCL